MTIKLAQLVGQIIELQMQYLGGHCNMIGRVREVQGTLWVGTACFRGHTEVRISTLLDQVSYVVDLGASPCYKGEEDG